MVLSRQIPSGLVSAMLGFFKRVLHSLLYKEIL